MRPEEDMLRFFPYKKFQKIYISFFSERDLEKEYSAKVKKCMECMGCDDSLVQCESLDCPIFFRRYIR